MAERIRWLALHGVVRGLSAVGMRSADPQARLIADPAVRVDPAVEAAESQGVRRGRGSAGSGPGQGSRERALASQILQRYQRLTGQRTHLESEQSYLNGRRVPNGTAGSARPDVRDTSTGASYDYKFTRSSTSPIPKRQKTHNQTHVPGATSGNRTAIHP